MPLQPIFLHDFTNSLKSLGKSNRFSPIMLNFGFIIRIYYDGTGILPPVTRIRIGLCDGEGYRIKNEG